MIQSACDPGAPQKVAQQATRGRVCCIAALPAKDVMPAKAVNPVIPATPSISRRVKRGFEPAMAVCFFATMRRPRLLSVS
jgi:hypothetical protein